jgi:hypothetical protein
MRILMLCDWLPPEFGAVGQYALKFAGDLAEVGHHVTLIGLTTQIASSTREPRGAGVLIVRRIRRPMYDKQSLRGRALWTLRTNISLLWCGLLELRLCNEIRFTGSPPYMLHFVMPVARLLRRHTRYRITDFHPECLIAEFERVPLPLRSLHAATRFWRRRVDVIEVLGEDQRRLLVADGIEPERIHLVRDPSPVLFSAGERPANPPEAIAGLKIVLYSGNFGVAHEQDTILEGFSAFELRHPHRLGVWLNATGSRVPAVLGGLRRQHVAVAHTKPVPLSDLPGVLLAADVHLICLRDRFVGYVLPSKVYACIESGRPILFVGNDRSDVHELCAAASAARRLTYRRVAVGDHSGVAAALEELLLEEHLPAAANRIHRTAVAVGS